MKRAVHMNSTWNNMTVPPLPHYFPKKKALTILSYCLVNKLFVQRFGDLKQN